MKKIRFKKVSWWMAILVAGGFIALLEPFIQLFFINILQRMGLNIPYYTWQGYLTNVVLVVIETLAVYGVIAYKMARNKKRLAFFGVLIFPLISIINGFLIYLMMRYVFA